MSSDRATDKRKASRKRVDMLLGTVEAEAGQEPKLCVFRDLSERGAQIELCDEVHLPQETALRFPKSDVSWPVRVVWHRDFSFGIEFARRDASADARIEIAAAS